MLRYAVTIHAGRQPVEQIIQVAEQVLAERLQDRVVVIQIPADDDRTAPLRSVLGDDPQVRIAPAMTDADAFIEAAFHVALPAGVAFSGSLLHRLRDGLGDQAAAEAFLPDGTRALIARTWLLHRGRGAEACFRTVGKVRQLSASKLGLRSVDRVGRSNGTRSAPDAGWPGTWPELLDWARGVRGPGDAWALLKWSACLAWWGAANQRRRIGLRLRRLSYDLGCGPNAAEPPKGFDRRLHSPIGWRRAAGREVAALGPLDLLPPGVEAHCVVRRDDVPRLRRAHHVEDVQAFHADTATRAATLVRLAAAGVVAHLADGGQGPAAAARIASIAKGRLKALLGDELHHLMTTDVRDADELARELLSIRMRRAALRDPAEPPLVSIILATTRPRFLPWLLAAAAGQTYPKLELVLALHGGPFTGVERRIAEIRHPVKLVRAPAGAPLGAVLNAATAAASGDLLAKMDDDDLYGPEHVRDLVLAHEYSRAPLVGKHTEFVYLLGSDRTVWCGRRRNEDWQGNVTGGAMLVARRELDRIGGWPRRAWGVDAALIGAFVRTGRPIYRTHGAGYMMVRHGGGHTWDVADQHFLAEADRVYPGWRTDVAGIEKPVLPYPALDGTGEVRVFGGGGGSSLVNSPGRTK